MEKQITVIVKWTRLIGLTFFVLGVALKSFYFYKLIETPFGGNMSITLGCSFLAVVYCLSSFASTPVLERFLRLGFSIFLIGSLFFFNHWPGGNMMLTISAVLIPVLILLLFVSKRNNPENENFTSELLFMIVILFLMVFYFISWSMHYSEFLATLNEASHAL
jgi:hypothetical protein